MRIVSITEQECLNWILCYPELVQRGFSVDNPRFADTASDYAGVINESEVLGVMKYERFSQYTMQIHCYLSPKYWGTSKLNECFELISDFFRRAGEKSLIAMCPEEALPAIYACKKVGFKKVGTVEQAVEWKGKTNNMILLQRML